jgi:pimeloyl-ACP methyl ester carboxylesterase/heme-degrading monooxygenase HmoA
MNNNEDQEIIKIKSHYNNLNLAITYKSSVSHSNEYPVLLLHGSTFSSLLSFGFKMNNYSWMDDLSINGYDVFALDFLGYGNSDRYIEMEANIKKGKAIGSAVEVYLDVDKAVDEIIKRSGKSKVYLIGHSWGGSVAALYAEKFPDKIEKLILFAAITERKDLNNFDPIKDSYETLIPLQRITAMKNLTPVDKECRLEPEIFSLWGNEWLDSDPIAQKYKYQSVRFPSGPSQDINNLLSNKPYYNPKNLKIQVLVIRGEWDEYPNNSDAENLFRNLENTPYKKYVVIEKGTHVMHLEKSRFRLYDEVRNFIKTENKLNKDKSLIAVIFEVIPRKGQKEEYLEIAANLKNELEKIEGFHSIERFQSIYNPEKILSLSFWESEEAILKWRNIKNHRNAQIKGRKYVFDDYNLRVANVIRDYGMLNRGQAPADSHSFHNK